MSQEVLTVCITVGVPAIAGVIIAIINLLGRQKDNRQIKKKLDDSDKKHEMENAKQRIISLIMQDRLSMHMGKIPKNYQRVCDEHDLYVKDGGNSYIADMIEEYKTEIDEFESSVKVHTDKK